MPGANAEMAFAPMELRPVDQGAIGKFHNLDGTVTDFAANPLTVVARLAPGVTHQLAEQMLSAISSALRL